MSNFKVGDWVKHKNKNSNYLKIDKIEGNLFDFYTAVDLRTFKRIEYSITMEPYYDIDDYRKLTKIEKILAGIE